MSETQDQVQFREGIRFACMSWYLWHY